MAKPVFNEEAIVNACARMLERFDNASEFRQWLADQNIDRELLYETAETIDSPLFVREVSFLLGFCLAWEVRNVG